MFFVCGDGGDGYYDEILWSVLPSGLKNRG
jgi:hypothetical protein